MIYKKYYYESNSYVKENNQYRQQIFNQVNCEDISYSRISSLPYLENDLIKYFKKYNICKNPEYKNSLNSEKKDAFNLYLTAGINSSSLTFENRSTIDFENSTSFRVGAEIEYILPFNNDKCSFLFETSYSTYSSKVKVGKTLFSAYDLNDYTIDYNYIDFAIGLRHYFFLNDNSKILANVGYVAALDLSNDSRSLKTSKSASYMFGIGYKYLNKYGIEARYNISREILHKNSPFISDFKTFSIIFSYNLFNY
ncbi:outer membrane beta-barrel protein [Mesonia aestuariivivens]|uniref:Porin family protein n=1 Tax=Mesonia aestuariivivens TaxID=2796128 RepID=A0ABS6VZL2_9FLAO|nr:outer membrane beta-barrel protein [Mesonia aestuariivivens]MBW2961045.1 porin family protein [Mesonia aestuariivivens]